MKSKIALLAVLLMLVGFGFYPLVMSCPLNCRHEDIDINTGQIRHQRILFGICVSERIEDSPVSKEADNTDVTPDWRRSNTFSPYVDHSPHYVFHSGINQTRKLERIWQLAVFTPGARKQISLEVLRLWQTGQCDDVVRGEPTVLTEVRPACDPTLCGHGEVDSACAPLYNVREDEQDLQPRTRKKTIIESPNITDADAHADFLASRGAGARFLHEYIITLGNRDAFHRKIHLGREARVLSTRRCHL